MDNQLLRADSWRFFSCVDTTSVETPLRLSPALRVELVVDWTRRRVQVSVDVVGHHAAAISFSVLDCDWRRRRLESRSDCCGDSSR